MSQTLAAINTRSWRHRAKKKKKKLAGIYRFVSKMLLFELCTVVVHVRTMEKFERCVIAL
jgi:hypothetical protein